MSVFTVKSTSLSAVGKLNGESLSGFKVLNPYYQGLDGNNYLWHLSRPGLYS